MDKGLNLYFVDKATGEPLLEEDGTQSQVTLDPETCLIVLEGCILEDCTPSVFIENTLKHAIRDFPASKDQHAGHPFS